MGAERDYTWRTTRRKENMGEIVEYNIQRNQLPPVGTNVIIHEKCVYERARGEEKVTCVYKPSMGYRDVYNYPLVFKVERYTKGIENPLDSRNNICLVRKTKDGRTVRAQIRTILVATGSMLLQDIGDNVINTTLHTYESNVSNSIIAEHGSTYNNSNDDKDNNENQKDNIKK